jgi:hypothetical protein
VGSFDGYAAEVTTRVARRFEGLDAGPHVLTVTVLGTGRPASTGSRVAVDALRWGGRLRRDPPATWTWHTVADPSASGGGYAIGDAAGASARVRFQGTGLTLRTRRGPSMGRAEVWVDGEFLRVVDLYASAAGFGSVPIVAGLPDGMHTARLVVTGRHRPASAGSSVAIDRWVVR